MPGLLQRRLCKTGSIIEAGFWPGGIPSSIQPPAETSPVELWDFPPIVKGWHQFFRENWVVSSSDDNDESRARQPQNLITTWTSAAQEFRDSYTDKAPGSKPRFTPEEISTYGCYNGVCVWGGCYLITDAPKPSVHWALWLKLLLMLYDFNNDVNIADVNIADEIFFMSPRENDAITLDNFKWYQAIETADFNIVKFNRDGQVLFDPHHRHSMLVDDCALSTGQVLIASFGLDGSPTDEYRVRCLDLFDPYLRIQGLGKSVEDQMEHFKSNLGPNDPEHWSKDEAIDMKQPLLDILCIYRDLTDTPLDDDRESIEERLNELAPGYLEAEREGDGLAKDFNLFDSGFET